MDDQKSDLEASLYAFPPRPSYTQADDELIGLQREFCPPIDPALLYALQEDYDLTDKSALATLRALLQDIKDSAETEGIPIFDPSASRAKSQTSTTEGSPERARSWHGDALSDETDLTTVSRSLASCSTDGKRYDGIASNTKDVSNLEDDGLDDLLEEDKLPALQDMFPAIKAFDIEYALKKAGNNFGKAVEDLLNQSFFEEERLKGGMPIVQKGIDGFVGSGQDDSPRGRRARGKRKKQNRRTSSTPAPESENSVSGPSPKGRWDRGREEIEFLAQRIHIPRQTLASIYHKSGASLPPTIAALCSSTDSTKSNPYLAYASPSVLNANVKELSREFPSLTQEQVGSLIRMTHPSTASAHELVRALLVSAYDSVGTTHITPQYSPRPRTPPSPITKDVHSPKPLPVSSPANLANVRSTAFSQANVAFKKSKSKPLMAGAAAYYSSVGRDAAAQLARHDAIVADALVSRQSRVGEVDLHGVSVRDAVRITISKVEEWWDGGAAEWARQGKVQGDGGLRIVTGIGRHSEGGRPKIGPAVGAMLVKEGWKVEVGQGVVLVRGRARK